MKKQVTGIALFVLLVTLCLGPLWGEKRVEAAQAPVAENDYKQGKVYKITPKTKPLKSSRYEKSSLYNARTRNYFAIRSYMEKFQKAKKGTLVLKKGTYTISNTIYVPSNVTIIMEDGVRIVKGSKTGRKKMPASLTIFQLIRPSKGEKSKVYGGHNGEKNIHFVGKGEVTVDLKYRKKVIALVMGHNKGVTVDNISFSNMNTAHFIEMDACKDMSITNCRFSNVKKGTDMVKEAINLDTPDKKTKGFNNAWSKQDKTPNEGVLIEDCTFTNLGRAIGTHKYSVKGNAQVYHTGIVLRGNHIQDMKWDSPIRIMNWKDSLVENNIIENVKQYGKDDTRGILVSGASNVSIKNNTISNVGRSIQYIAWKNSGPGSEYLITYNFLSKENREDLKTNIGKDLFLGEYFVRICPKYNVFTHAETIDIICG